MAAVTVQILICSTTAIQIGLFIGWTDVRDAYGNIFSQGCVTCEILQHTGEETRVVALRTSRRHWTECAADNRIANTAPRQTHHSRLSQCTDDKRYLPNTAEQAEHWTKRQYNTEHSVKEAIQTKPDNIKKLKTETKVTKNTWAYILTPEDTYRHQYEKHKTSDAVISTAVGWFMFTFSSETKVANLIATISNNDKTNWDEIKFEAMQLSHCNTIENDTVMGNAVIPR